MFAGCEADPEFFRVAKAAMVKLLAHAALDAEIDVELTEKTAEAAITVTSLAPKIEPADQPWSFQDELSLYQCTRRDVLSFLGLLWQNVESADLHRDRPVHCRSEPYKRRMQEMDAEDIALRIPEHALWP